MTSKIDNGGISGRIPVDLIADALLASPDGATIETTGLPYRGHGVIVALPEFGRTVSPRGQEVLGREGFTLAEWVATWVRRNAHHVTGQHLRPRAFGAWTEHGTLYLDVVEVFPADQEAEAVAAGRARNQISVWHAGRQEEIPTGGTGESVPTDTRPALRDQYVAGDLIIDPESTGPGFYVIHESEPVWGPGHEDTAREVAERYRNAHTSVVIAWLDSVE